jgi:hypothetical protein
MRNLEVGLLVGVGIALSLCIAIWLVRWARKGRLGATMLGGALFLLLGGALVPQSPQQRIEEAREQRGKKGAESGDPPTDQEAKARTSRIAWRMLRRGRSNHWRGP